LNFITDLLAIEALRARKLRATETVRRTHLRFTFMAEVYSDLEWTMRQQGFD